MNKNLPTSKSIDIPVKISNDLIKGDPTLSGYQTPEFRHVENKEVSNNYDRGTNFIETKAKAASEKKVKEIDEVVHEDINHFVQQLGNKAASQSKIDILKEGSGRLSEQIEELKRKATDDCDYLIEGKKVALRLNNLLERYHNKMIQDAKGQKLRLANEITLKNLLRDKIAREMQGFRISSEEFKELEQVNPQDIQKIYSAVEKKIGKRIDY